MNKKWQQLTVQPLKLDDGDVHCLLQITKIINKKKSAAYSFRQSFPLCGMTVYLFDTPRKDFCVIICRFGTVMNVNIVCLMCIC